ncbi:MULTISPECIES: hypothetical protein [Rhodopirellula]|uniref:hypothetical protein n=1 Tax=Rhodopirellula TaxID=265488 RepID=UPI00257BBBEA|nr:hypothetical protein [Rhodopirellula sp. UBA1907]|tara:strand:- start:3987 stop:4364 length:378 start_codon:yes stop_codon:yes gene_type:complete
MAKFYVQSGTFRSVVAADSARKAALWAVHQVMQQVLPTDEDTDSLSASATNETSAQKTSPNQATGTSSDRNDGSTPVAVLDGRVRISERGYDRNDCAEMPTMEVVAEWNQMVLTLDRLQQMMRHG